MATYVYNYQRKGKGEMIAAYKDRYIFDVRGKTLISDAKIVAERSGNYLKIYKGRSSEYTNITVNGNIAYKAKEYYLTAKNNIIYSKNKVELAEYEGNAEEALFAYAALQILKGRNTAKNNSEKPYSTSASKSSSDGSTNTANSSGCSTWVIFAVLTVICGYYGLLSEVFYKYYTFLHIIVPALIMLGILIKRDIKDEEYEYPFASSVGNFITGILIGFVIIFIVGSHDILIHSIMGQNRSFLIPIDMAYGICIFEIGMISVMNGAKKKK